MKTGETRSIRCPLCHRGRLIDAAPHTDLSTLQLFGPRHADKAEWFAKCPKCGAQIGIKFQPNTEQRQAGA